VEQLYAYMLPNDSKSTEIVNLVVAYGLAVCYEDKSGWLYKFTVNFKMLVQVQ